VRKFRQKTEYQWGMDAVRAIAKLKKGGTGKEVGRIFCDRHQRPCVVHDQEGACTVCDTQKHASADIRSPFELI